MDDLLYTVFWIGTVIILPLAAVAALGYVTVRRGRWKPYVLVNLAVIVGVGFLAASSDGDMNAPVPHLAMVLFMVAYLPGHLLIAALVGGAYWYRSGRHAL